MGERGLMDSVNDVVKAAFELYAADGKKLNDDAPAEQCHYG